MINRWLISLRLLFTVPSCRETGDCGALVAKALSQLSRHWNSGTATGSNMTSFCSANSNDPQWKMKQHACAIFENGNSGLPTPAAIMSTLLFPFQHRLVTRSEIKSRPTAHEFCDKIGLCSLIAPSGPSAVTGNVSIPKMNWNRSSCMRQKPRIEKPETFNNI